MFGTILTIVVTLFHLYLFWRASSIEIVTRRVPKRYIALSGLLLWSLFVAGRFYGHDQQGWLAGVLEHLTMNWMGALFLCSCTLLLVDLLTGFGRFWQPHLGLLRGVGLVAGLVLTLLALYQGMRAPVISEYEVTLKALPGELDGTVIVALSDLHLGSRVDAKWLEARVAQINAAKPDLIVLLGDIYEGHSEPSAQLRTALASLKASQGVWAVLGNHEFHRGETPQAAAFRENGFTVLRNSSAKLEGGLVLVGVDDLTNGRRNGNGRNALQKVLANRPSGAAILLSHSPLYDELSAGAGIGLMLSGHTHGGQLWPFGYLVRQRYPLLSGRYQIGAMTVLVSRGTGTWGPRMRLWAPAEIMRITLRAGSHERGLL